MTRVDALSFVDMSLLLILIPVEEPPHLTADYSNLRNYVGKTSGASGFVWQVPHDAVDVALVLTQITLEPIYLWF